MDYKKFTEKKWIGLLFCFLVAVIYHQALWVAFYLDDYISIANNTALLSFNWQDYLLHRRFVPYFSFYVDHQLWALNVQAFHLHNLVLHAINAILVYVLVNRLTKLTTGSCQPIFALFVASLWLVHPLNSQPVIYIVQRITLLLTLFSLLTVYCWLCFRTYEKHRAVWLLLAAVSGVMACLSKETALLLPLVLLLVDKIILNQPRKQLVYWYLVPFLIVLSLLGLALLLDLTSLTTLDALTRDHAQMTRWEYFLAQQQIVAVYLYKIVVPFPLLLEYSFYQPGNLSTAWPWLLLHVALVLSAVLCYRKLPLYSFGVLFYYSLHWIESGLIPITDLAFEHRAYLPNFGLLLALVSLLNKWCRHISAKLLISAAVLLIIGLSAVTVNRVLQWQEPTDFYLRELSHSPQSIRVLSQLGNIYQQNNDLAMAEYYFRQSFMLSWQQQRITLVQANNLLKIFIVRNKVQEAQRLAQELDASFAHNPRWQSAILTTLSTLYTKHKRCDLALPHLQRAVELDSQNDEAQRLTTWCQSQ